MTDDAESVLQLMKDGWYLDVPGDGTAPTIFITGESDETGLIPLDVKSVAGSVAVELIQSSEVEMWRKWEPPERSAAVYKFANRLKFQ